MFIRQPRDARQERHHDRASTFYKLVLKWQKEKQGAHGRNSRQAAIGLPEAVRTNTAHTHVQRFILEALRDGMPLEELEAALRELKRLKNGG